ncbi:probable glutamate receptor [Panulirus ornatus]|uniref:probable glutamate receptor n=1 Tax=Panulirus ornatus TaxID=150431 RepID=UPI003A8C366D
MEVLVRTSFLFTILPIFLALAQFPRRDDETITQASGAVGAVVSVSPHPDCSVFLITDANSSASSVATMVGQLRVPGGVAVFEAAAAAAVVADGQEATLMQMELSRVVGEIQRLRQLSVCVTVVVVSDDPTFLAAFVGWSLKGRLPVWSTRLLVVTRLPLQELSDLQGSLSKANAMLLVVENTPTSQRCCLYINLPNIPQEEQALRVASWTPHRGLSLTTHLPLFPDKFFKFITRPTLVVAVEALPYNVIRVIDEPTAPGGQRLTFTGSMANIVDFASRSMNFTYRYVRSSDKSFGSRQHNGSWTGMIGMVVRKEADFATGPFAMTFSRVEAVDFTYRVRSGEMKLMGATGRPEVAPWGFLLPLTSLVWVAILLSLLVVPPLLFLLPKCFHLKDLKKGDKSAHTFIFIRILLQQDVSEEAVFVWERLVLGVWMMMTLVLTRSYAGNLMSLLAVRHLPQPYQTLQDILDDPSVITIWQKNSAPEQYLRSVQSGTFREIADMEAEGRLKFHTSSQFFSSVNTLVRWGDHVIVNDDRTIKYLVTLDFSRTGRCDFYISRDGFLPYSASLITQKYSPLTYGLSMRIMTLLETGLISYWVTKSMPNTTYCRYPPKKITVNTTIAMRNVWGMFVLLGGGHACGLLLLCLEVLSSLSGLSQDLREGSS